MAEQGIKPGQKVKLQENHFLIDDVEHPIMPGKPEEGPAVGITVKPFILTDELGKKMDGAEITFEPGSESTIQLFRGDRWIQDFVTKGKGTWILLDDQGQTHVVEVDTKENSDFLLAEYQTGWASVILADKNGPGLEFVEMASPPWDPNEYETLKLNDSRLTDEFREKYEKFH